MVIMIDNYDSFTYNLVRYCQEIGIEINVYSNDQITIEQIQSLEPKAILISPGPGRPEDSGTCPQVIKHFAGKIPILGVCLGHQAIAQVFGARIITSRKIMHGKTSLCYHVNEGIFENLSYPLRVARYHSLVVDKDSLPECLRVTGWTLDEDQCVDEIMAIEHRSGLLAGVQFHPEAILSNHGQDILRLFFKKFGIPVNENAYQELTPELTAALNLYEGLKA